MKTRREELRLKFAVEPDEEYLEKFAVEPDEEYLEKFAVEDELILGDYIRFDNGIVEPDTFATEEHDKTAELARKHRRAMKKAKHDVCMQVRRKRNRDEAIREKGFKSFPYAADTFDKVDKPIKMAKIKVQALADMKNQMHELGAAIDELPSIWDENSIVEAEPEIEVDPDDFEFSIWQVEVGYEKGREDGYKDGYEAGYKAAREEFLAAFAKMTASWQ